MQKRTRFARETLMKEKKPTARIGVSEKRKKPRP